ncbi:MAG TPA: response regulator transcription factor [Thermoanaerobaculia bacterium]|nr:response regulator transcription factor [Thermoanaerobaculia bacterium]
MSERPITIVLADDQGVVRQGLCALLSTVASFSVVGEAADAAHAVGLAAELLPVVLVLDLMAPARAGVDVIYQVRKRKLPVRIVVLSATVDEEHVAEAVAAGADAYVRKDASADDLVHAIREAACGRRYLSPPWSEEELAAQRQRAGAAATDRYGSLTEREREVLHLAAGGLRNREIASQLGISPRTVESHRAHLMAKLGLRREADLVRYALRRGIVSLDGGEAPAR